MNSFSRFRCQIPALAIVLFMLVLTAGYFDMRVNSPELYGGEHSNYAAPNKGMDFKAVYNYGVALRSGMSEYAAVSSRWPHNPYPPLVTVALLPMTIFPPEFAAHLFAAVLMLFLFITCRACLASGGYEPEWGRTVTATIITAVLFHTYPVNFSIERGNSDIVAAMFAALFVLCLTRNRVIPAVICLTVSMQFKIYPAILAALLLVRYGWQPLLSLAGINAALLFVLGKTGFDTFRSVLGAFSARPFDWPGNHSLHSFANHLARTGVIPPEWESGLRTGTMWFLLAIFGAAAIRLYLAGRCRKSGAAGVLTGAEVGLVGMAFIIMALLPIISHDYKLVIQLVPLLLLMTTPPEAFGKPGGAGVVVVAIVFCCAGFMFVPSHAPFFLGWIGDEYGELLKIKTPWLLISFLPYAFLGVRGSVSVPSGICGVNKE